VRTAPRRVSGSGLLKYLAGVKPARLAEVYFAAPFEYRVLAAVLMFGAEQSTARN